MTRNSPSKRLDPWDSSDVYGPHVSRNTPRARYQTKMTDLRRKLPPNWTNSGTVSSFVLMSSYLVCLPWNKLWSRLKNDWSACSRTGINPRGVIWPCWWVWKGAREWLPAEECVMEYSSQGRKIMEDNLFKCSIRVLTEYLDLQYGADCNYMWLLTSLGYVVKQF